MSRYCGERKIIVEKKQAIQVLESKLQFRKKSDLFLYNCMDSIINEIRTSVDDIQEKQIFIVFSPRRKEVIVTSNLLTLDVEANNIISFPCEDVYELDYALRNVIYSWIKIISPKCKLIISSTIIRDSGEESIIFQYVID